MGVQSNAALANLTIAKSAYDKDIVLQWVCEIASPFQMNVTVDSKSSLKLEAQGVVLTSRNAILRGICGVALHGALDQSPYYLLGGTGFSAALKVGQLIQWMSAADSLRTGATLDSIASDLEYRLQNRSFLIGSSQPSLADYDLALEIEGNAIDAVIYPEVKRWHSAVLWAFRQLAKGNLLMPATTPLTSGPITFYYGNEDITSVLRQPETRAAPVKRKAIENGANGGNQANKTPPSENAEVKQKSKREKGNEKQETQAASAPDISALDIRVGKIVKVWDHETADKLFCEEIDLGTETRQIASGLRPFYKREDLEGRVVIVLCNLKKRNLVGFASHGMVLCASNADHTSVEFVVPAEGSKLGERIKFGDYEGEPEVENKVAKKKIFEGLAPDLKTNTDGQVMWKDSLAKTEAGVVRALNGMPNAQVA